MADEHPARKAGLLSQQYVAAGERDRWLELFAEDAVVQDPIGISPLDPIGKGQVGKSAITAFYDNAIAKGDVSFDFPRSYACGNECAFIGTVHMKFGDVEGASEGVFVYRVDEEGKIVSMRAYWEHERPQWQGPPHPPVGRDRP